MKKNIGNIVTTGVFCTVIFGFTIATFLSPKKDFSANENRTLALAPAFTMKSLLSGSFATDYETYLTDQFVLRDKWIAVKTIAEKSILKKDINGVYLASDNYLIEMNETVDEELLKTNSDRLISFTEKYNEKLGKDHVNVMIVPTASEVLSDKLPAYAKSFDEAAMLDYISEGTGNNFIDMRDSLKAHRDDYVFYKTDHHWTMSGAYLAYEKWANKAGIKPYATNDFNISERSGFKGTIYSKINYATELDTVSMYEAKFPIKYTVDYGNDDVRDTIFAKEHLSEKDMYPVYLDGNHALVRVDTDVKNGKKLLIIKDSYAHSFATLAVNHYETTYLVDFRYYRASISKFIEENGITDVLVLYNCVQFATDKNTALFLK